MQFLSSLVGFFMSIPYIVLFFAVWIVSSLWRPIAVLSWIAFLSQPMAALRKAQLLWTTVVFLTLCKDKKWNKKTTDPATYFPKQQQGGDADAMEEKAKAKIESKTIIFVRHGESCWNDTFNKGPDRSKLQFIMGFIPGLLKALVYEWYYGVSGRANSSWMYDSPLSEKGYKQALGVQAFLKSPVEYMTPKEAQLMKLLLGQEVEPVNDASKETQPATDDKKKSRPKRSSVIVSSNLRRAIATVAVGFQDRLLSEDNSDDDDDDDDKIVVLQSLQEISFNPDALSITPPYTKVEVDDNIPRLLDDSSNNDSCSSKTSPDALLLHPGRLNRIYDDKIAVQLSHGNKSLQSNGIQRLRAFCKEVFTEPDLADFSTVIAGGHSLWFRSFFQTFLPHGVDHIAKRKKLINGGIVALTLQRIPVVSSTTEAAPAPAPAPAASIHKKSSKDDDGYQYMIDPSSIVVLHGGF